MSFLCTQGHEIRKQQSKGKPNLLTVSGGAAFAKFTKAIFIQEDVLFLESLLDVQLVRGECILKQMFVTPKIVDRTCMQKRRRMVKHKAHMT